MKFFAFAASAVFGAAAASYTGHHASTPTTAQAAYRAIEEVSHFKDEKWFRGSNTPINSKFRYYTLGEVIPMTHDVALFRFLLPKEDDVFALRPCSTLQARLKEGVQAIDIVERFYTPVTSNGTKGYFDIIVRRQKQGRMTNHLFGLRPGDEMQFRTVMFKMQYRPNKWKQLGLIAGGTGLTPMLQVVRAALEGIDPTAAVSGPPDRTKLSLLYCNRTERHILVRGLIDNLARAHPDRFRVTYCVDTPLKPEAWRGYTGLITKEMLEATMPKSDPDNLILLCGPDGMLSHVAGTPMGVLQVMSSSKNIQPAAELVNLTDVGGLLGELGWDSSNVYRF
jgi:cytochrome-b5 reductase